MTSAFPDNERIRSTFDVLMRAGERVQVIVLAFRKRRFTRLGAASLEIGNTGMTLTDGRSAGVLQHLNDVRRLCR
jgi:hypothetical protein